MISLFSAKVPTMSINWLHDEDAHGATLDLNNYVRHHSRIMTRQLHSMVQDMQLNSPWNFSSLHKPHVTSKQTIDYDGSSDALDVVANTDVQESVYIGRRSGLKLSASNTPVKVKSSKSESTSSSTKTDIAPYNLLRVSEVDLIDPTTNVGGIQLGRKEDDDKETKEDHRGDPRELSFGIAPDILDEDEHEFTTPAALVALGTLLTSSSSGMSDMESKRTDMSTDQVTAPDATPSHLLVTRRNNTDGSAATTPEPLDSDRDVEDNKEPHEVTDSNDSVDVATNIQSPFYSSPFEEPSISSNAVDPLESSSTATITEDVEAVVLIDQKQGARTSPGAPIVNWIQSTINAALTFHGTHNVGCDCKNTSEQQSKQECGVCTTPTPTPMHKNRQRVSDGYSSADITPLSTSLLHQQAYNMSCIGSDERSAIISDKPTESNTQLTRPSSFPYFNQTTSDIPSSSAVHTHVNNKHLISSISSVAISAYQRTRQLHNKGWEAILASISTSPEQCLLYGEVLYILRPLVYAWVKFGLQKQSVDRSSSTGRSDTEGNSDAVVMHQFLSSLGSILNADDGDNSFDFVALIVSLVIELLSIQLTSIGLDLARAEARRSVIQRDPDLAYLVEDLPHTIGNPLHKFDTELRRRKSALFFYLLRSPVFNRTTQPFFRLLSQSLRSVPFVSTLPDSILGALQYLNGSHFRSAASS